MFSPLILAKKNFIAVWNVGKTRLFGVDQRIVCLRKERLTWCTVTIQSQTRRSDQFSTSPSHLHNVSNFDQTFFPFLPLFLVSFPLSPSRTWPYLYLSNVSQNKLAEKFLNKSFEAPLITNSTNLIKQFFWKVKRGKNMLEKYLWVYAFFQHLLSELSWLCMISHLEAYIKEIWHNNL